jgi:hypothetical protein
VSVLKPCKDCTAEWEPYAPPKRPAPFPGPRCATHHRAKRKAAKAKAHEARVCATYGLEPGEYAKRYAEQDGRCAICRRATGATRRLSVDHDHATGKVRGLLCRPCNDLLGHARDDLYFFVRAYHYLKGQEA